MCKVKQVLCYEGAIYALSDLDDEAKKTPMDDAEYRRRASAILGIDPADYEGVERLSLFVI